MSQSTSPAVKLLIQSGMIPENTLQQLINWKLLPGGYSSLHGDKPVSLESKWTTVEEFVDRLRAALTEEMGIIRETELDRTGGFRKAQMKACAPCCDTMHTLPDTEVFVDRLGRVLLPARDPYTHVELVSLDGGAFREIVRRESRYEGEKQVAWVCYLEGDPNAC